MIIRWIGSLAGAALLTVATFLAMPELLRIDDPEAGEEFHRLYALYNPRGAIEPFPGLLWVCDECQFDNGPRLFIGTAAVLEDIGARPDSTCEFPVRFQQFALSPYALVSWVDIWVETDGAWSWGADHPFDRCGPGAGLCLLSHRHSAIEQVANCLVENRELATGEHRFTIIYVEA